MNCRIVLALIALVAAAGCDTSTSRLTQEQGQRFASEGVLHRADDQIFRYTEDPGGRSERREDRKASIIVTKSSLLIHKNAKVGLEITPRSQKELSVQRSGNRVRIHAGKGKSETIWSFTPPDDADGWTRDIRALMRTSAAGRK